MQPQILFYHAKFISTRIDLEFVYLNLLFKVFYYD